MEENVDQLKQKVEHYEKILRLEKSDVTIEGYRVFVEILSQQTKYLSQFVLEDKIKAAEKTAEHIAYKNAKELWEKLPALIQAVLKLREDLKIDAEPELLQRSELPISPQSIAKLTVTG